MKKHYMLGVMLIVSLMLVLVGCGSKSSSNDPAPSNQTGQTSSEDPAPSQEVKTLNIGYTGPLSGGGALFGKDVTDGLDLAVDVINEKGLNVNGEIYKINLIKLDDQYLPDKAATNARRLVTEYNTPVILVPHSGGAFALQQFNEQDNFLLMAFTSEPKIAQTGNSLTVQMTSPYNLYPEVYSQKVMEKFGKRLALIPTASQYGKDWTENLVPAWERLGGT
ncbi:MAG: ABC transporter substrate-binding protein, partial [Desulfitobacterium sp.]|nr:ABC transporter substrate-binding protein [Desulfitobacterium sp.]